MVDDKCSDLLFTRIELETETLNSLEHGASARIGRRSGRGGWSAHTQCARDILNVFLGDVESDPVFGGQAGSVDYRPADY